MADTDADIDEVVLPTLSEADLARWLAAGGVKTVRHLNRYWQEVVPGFFLPVHYLARFRADEITPPRRFCWGMRAVLGDTEAQRANASLPVYVMPDLANYGRHRLSRRRRSMLTRAKRFVTLVVLRSPRLLLEQGAAVLREAKARNPANQPVPEAAFEQWVRASLEQPGPMIIGFLAENRLLGLSISFAIDGVGYAHQSFMADTGRHLKLDFLAFHTEVMIAQRTPNIHTMVNGLHTPENQGLCDFKREQGLVVANYPSIAKINLLARMAIGHTRPHQYYRLTGQMKHQPDLA
jgi:hypothetical protein